MDCFVGPEYFAGREPLGDGAFTLAVGGIAVRVEGLSDTLKAAALERYAPFLSDDPPAHVVRVVSGQADYLDLAKDGYLRLEERDHPSGLVMMSHYFAAFCPRDGSHGTLCIAPDQEIRKAVGGIENYLRWRFADMVLERGGFIVHSAGLVVDGKAYLFFGHSGAGKSTATAISVEARGALPLSDDLVLVTKGGGRFMGATTPFWGTMPQTVKEKGSYPISGLYHLRQASFVETRPVPMALAIGMLLSCCPFVADSRRRSQFLLPHVEDLCSTVPLRELFFKKDPSFWDLVAGPEERT